jgi:hypothetical protein
MQIRQGQHTLMVQSFQEQAALVILQPAVGPLPIQPFADRTGDLGDSQSSVIGSGLAHEAQLIGGEAAAGKGDGCEIVHHFGRTLLRTVGYQIQHDWSGREEQSGDPIEGVFALLDTRRQNADHNLLSLCAILGAVATPGLAGHHSGT